VVLSYRLLYTDQALNTLVNIRHTLTPGPTHTSRIMQEGPGLKFGQAFMT